MAEAELLADGLHLGPVGGRIVGEVFIGLMQLDPGSYLNAQPGWTPTLPTQSTGTFGMTDLLRFARVDPASRGRRSVPPSAVSTVAPDRFEQFTLAASWLTSTG